MSFIAYKKRQSGAAIITALLTVMLAATIAAALLAEQSSALTRTARGVERAQLLLHANTTLAWARTALQVQQRNSTYVALSQPWAEGLVARPIETAVATGVLRDAQAKFNINNLIDGAGKRREADAEFFSRLLVALKLDSALAPAIVDWLDSDDEVSGASGAENGYYWQQRPAWRAANRAIVNIDELRRVKGMTDAIFNKLSPFITALPTQNGERTRININTTSATLLSALFNNNSEADIADTLRLRELPYKDVADIRGRRGMLAQALVDSFLDAKSRYFEASLAITGEGTQVRQAALLEVAPGMGASAGSSALPAIIWVKDE
jgi:general secretion pathway protein K